MFKPFDQVVKQNSNRLKQIHSLKWNYKAIKHLFYHPIHHKSTLIATVNKSDLSCKTQQEAAPS